MRNRIEKKKCPWTVNERWTSRNWNEKFNVFLFHFWEKILIFKLTSQCASGFTSFIKRSNVCEKGPWPAWNIPKIQLSKPWPGQRDNTEPPTKYSINQSIDMTNNRSTDQSINQSINPVINRYCYQSNNKSIKQSINPFSHRTTTDLPHPSHDTIPQ